MNYKALMMRTKENIRPLLDEMVAYDILETDHIGYRPSEKLLMMFAMNYDETKDDSSNTISAIMKIVGTNDITQIIQYSAILDAFNIREEIIHEHIP